MIGIFINLWNRLIGAGGAAISYVLDEYGGAAAAYSLRKLSSTYGGSAVRVRRASDNAEQDIGFVGQDLDETALMNFVGYQNLFLQSETFEMVSWIKLGTTAITANATTDPIGGNTAELATSTAGQELNVHQMINPVVAGQSYTNSIYVKKLTATVCTVYIFSQTTTSLIAASQLNFDTGVLTTSIGSGVVQNVGNGWYRVSVTAVTANAGNHTFGVYNPTGTVGAGNFYIWGAQLNIGTTAQPYQVTTSAARSGDGFVTKWYTQDSNWENLLLQSKTFENASWTKTATTVSANSTTDPIGGSTGYTIFETASNSQHFISQTNAYSAGTYTFSVYMKYLNRKYVLLDLSDNVANGTGVVFDIELGSYVGISSVGTGYTLQSYSISPQANGWYRYSITVSTSGIPQSDIQLRNSNTLSWLNIYTGSASVGIYIWGAQLSQSTWIQPYQVTTTTAILRRDASQSTAANQPRIVGGGVIERENGKATMFFDGVNDNLQSTSLTLPAYSSVFLTSKTINTANPIFVEHGPNSSVTDGFFTSTNSVGSFALYQVRRTSNQFALGVTGWFPMSFSLADWIYNGVLSVDRNGVDVPNGAITGTAVSNTNTTNVLNIGSRNGASLFSNSDLSELVIYPSDQTANRSLIQKNLGAYYQTQWTGASSGLLDQFGGAAAAYSLRNLSSSYRGPLIRVRRSSDNAETDIGGTYNGDLDVASLLSFTGGQNLVTYSEQFGAATWSLFSSTISTNATIAPDGTLTADKLTETALNDQHGVRQLYTPSSTAPHTLSFYAKSAERSKIAIAVYLNSGSFGGFGLLVDLSNGTIYKTDITSSSSVIISSSIQNIGNGWYRVSITGTTNFSGIHAYQISPLNDSWQQFYLGTAGSGVYIWGAQLNTGILQPYIPTTTTAVNGANAFVTKWYTQDNNYQNLVLQSQTFENAYWQKFNCVIVQDTIAAPDGTLTAEKVIEAVGTNVKYLYPSSGVSVSANIYTGSVYAKAGERSRLVMGIWSGTDYQLVQFDLSNGTIVQEAAAGIASISSVGNGWYRCTVTRTVGAVTTYLSFGPYINSNIGTLTGTFQNAIYTGDGTSGIYIWGAQLNEGNVAQPYTATTTTVSQRRDAIQATAAAQPRIVNAGGVDSEGNKPALFFDGTDDSLTMSSIETSNLDWSVFYAARNNSSSSTGFGIGSLAGPPTVFFGRISDGSLYLQNDGSTDYYYSVSEPSTTFNLTSGFSRGSSANAFLNGVQLSLSGPLVYTSLSSSFNLIGGLASIRSNAEASELVLYVSNQLSNRPNIQSNINSYYRIYWQGNGTALLDNYSGASAAYSLRNLSSAYTGPLIRVRRSNDNVERDIYGTFGGDLDIASLVAFVGANSGFVTTWYDQSGNAINATQTTAANQPRIVNAGVVETEGGKPSINFFGTSAFMNANGAFTGTSFTSFSVYKQPSTVSRNAYNLYTTGGTYVQIVEYSSGSSSYIRPSTGVATQYGAGVFVDRQLRSFTYIDSFIFTDYRNTGIFYSNNFGVTMTPSTSLQINRFGGTYGENLVFQELIFFPTDRSSIRTAAETNINNYYKIY